MIRPDAVFRNLAGFLIGVPLLISFIFSRLVADPFYEVVLAFNPDAFELSDRTKIEGAEEVHIHEMRLRMDAALGRAPPLTEAELQASLASWSCYQERAILGACIHRGCLSVQNLAYEPLIAALMKSFLESFT